MDYGSFLSGENKKTRNPLHLIFFRVNYCPKSVHDENSCTRKQRCEMEDLLTEIQAIWPHCSGIRKNNGSYEFAIETCQGDLCWFSIGQAPERVEKYLHKVASLIQ